LLPNIAAPIVSSDEQAVVLARLAHNQANATRNNRHPEATLLRAGFIRCAHCGQAMHADRNPAAGPLYRCYRGAREREVCPFPSILAKFVDPMAWAQVEAVLRDPGIIAREVERRRSDGSLDCALAGIETRLAALAQKQANTARAIAALNDDAAAAPLLAELRTLAEQKTAAEAERAELRRRIADRAADDAKLRDLAGWCATVGANIDTLTYDEKRLALAWLGVHVKVWRPGTVDDGGEPMRWEMTMAPIGGDPIVYRAAPVASPHRS
jgi:site-specific DNA recombinase